MKLLALVEEPDHVCCRYRIRAFEPALARAGSSLTCRGARSSERFSARSSFTAQGFRRRHPAAQATAKLAIERTAPRCAASGVRL